MGKARPFSEEADPAKVGGWGPHEETQGVCVIKQPLHAAGTPEITHQPPTPVLPNQHKLECKCRPLPATTSSGEAPQGRGFVYPHTPAGLRGTRAAPLEYQDLGGGAAQSGGVSLGLPPRSLAHHTVWAPGKPTGTICTSHHVCFTTAPLRPLDSKVRPLPAAPHSSPFRAWAMGQAGLLASEDTCPRPKKHMHIHAMAHPGQRSERGSW